MSTPLTIGIAACSAEGAALCYRTICSEASDQMGLHQHPEIVMHTPSLGSYVEALENNDIETVASLMVASAEKLEAAGADFVICPDNTIHSAIHLAAEASMIPWLNIAQVVSKHAKCRGMQRVGLLGTKWLVQSDVYTSSLLEVGISVVKPSESAINQVNEIIMNELVLNLQDKLSTHFLLDVIRDLKADGCDGAVLGCTELPIVLNDENACLPTLDSTRMLANEALAYSLGCSQGHQ
ncbi:MAG: amino acid racemase [Pseudomonadota bacterium]